ncbi:hypothetical protein HELRODRAFT_171077 [Helobdella robusta]|uniref:Major facilitator superfamily (MFS) profile domain-containing protein n=1 Tax=Helobdella robusta TaxID=6412 RepID=T1F3S7_HELRO|nr:hypothetical protein HELRODRAFT_171077 [Helobdella robusta]ESO07035.1 hypothetical protein HELRODRAFT_171077 [Helobdella robusta]
MASSFVNNLEWLFFTHSLLYGMGSSLIYMASSLVIGEHFGKDHKYHVLATSILLCGYPIGSLIFNPVHAWLIESFTWRTAFRATSGLILLTGLVCCWNFSPKESGDAMRIAEVDDEYNDEYPVEDDSSAYNRFRLGIFLERPEIILWFLGNMLSYLGFYMPFMNLAHYMQRRNITPKWSSLALILLSLAECVTYITASFLGDYLKDRLVYVNVAASGALAVICLVWPLIDVSYGMILAISLAMGGFLGLNIVYTYAASRETTKLPIDIAWSYTNLWSGFIYDINNSYTGVFFVVGGVYLLDTCIFGAIPLLQYRRELKHSKNLDSTDLENKSYETLKFSTKLPQQQQSQQPQQPQPFSNDLRKTSLTNGGATNAVGGGGSSGPDLNTSLYVQGPVPCTMTTVVKQHEQQSVVSFDRGPRHGNNPFQKNGGEAVNVNINYNNNSNNNYYDDNNNNNNNINNNSVGDYAGAWQANFDNDNINNE